jgi:predicted PurR-regulated permease PerM
MKKSPVPIITRVTIILIGMYALLSILYIAQNIIVPIVFAVIIAIVLHPVVNFFVRLKMNRIFAITLTVVLAISIGAALCYLLLSQLSQLSESWPILVDRFIDTLNKIIIWASSHFNLNPIKVHEWITNTKNELIDTNSIFIGQTLLNVGSWLVSLVLVPVYIFMILFYQPLILDFIHKLFDARNQSQLSEVVAQIKTVIQRYLTGLIIEAVIIAIMYSTALLILGIDYAILLGIIGASINVIPYIGGIVGIALPMMVALVTEPTSWQAFYILIIFLGIQLIDNHYIIPKIVASKVKINALFSMIAIIAGNALWGIPGMLLSIPLLGIIKLIFDHIEPLKPWGFLLGDTMPPVLIRPIMGKIGKKVTHLLRLKKQI